MQHVVQISDSHIQSLGALDQSLALAAAGKTLFVVDKGTILFSYLLEAEIKSVHAHQAQQKVAVVLEQGNVKILAWNREKRMLMQHRQISCNNKTVTDVNYSFSNDRYMALGFSDGYVQVWDLEKQDIKRVF